MLLRRTISASFVLCAIWAGANGQRSHANNSTKISQATLIQITRAEDERRWDDTLKNLLSSKDPAVRKRAALAAGRIGAEDAVPPLAEMLLGDRDADVRAMAAFALGETESAGAAYALVETVKKTNFSEQPNDAARARAMEAIGKITAALIANAGNPAGGSPRPEDERLDKLRTTLMEALQVELDRRPQGDRLTILLGLTAVLRARPDGAGPVVAKFLESSDPAIVATALNTMARLRLKNANERVQKLLGSSDPMVRANAARVLGAAEHKEAFEELLARALNDADLRVRVSAIRSLALLKDLRALDPLLKRGSSLLDITQPRQSARNELLEIVTTVGRLVPNSANKDAVAFLHSMHADTKGEAVEVETTFARVAPQIYLDDYKGEASRPNTTWRQLSRRAQGLAAMKEVMSTPAPSTAESATLKLAQAELSTMAHNAGAPLLAVSDILDAYASYKPADLEDLARQKLQSPDINVRSTAAQILGNQPPSDANRQALIAALPSALKASDNDAAMAILGALAKQKNDAANEAIKTALDASDHLIRRRAVALLKTNGVGDFSDRIGMVKSRNTEADYRRALARTGRKVTATIVTNRGSFTIEFLPDQAPLTVDNFVQLARRRYFNGQTIPRVVPNFVIQAGDPRGDQSGGPGYSIRCEINEVPFERAALGMALSGKDTGGSQWFVTHSPQPHLDGGYTVFGRVVSGMEVVDNIVRGDTIQRVIVNER